MKKRIKSASLLSVAVVSVLLGMSQSSVKAQDIFQDMTFDIENRTYQDIRLENERGAAILAISSGISSNPSKIIKSKFKNNLASIGGAISAEASNFTVSDQTTFTGNSAINAGGAIYSLDSILTVENSIFGGTDTNDYNVSQYGGAVYSLGMSPSATSLTTIKKTSFINNKAVEFGGAIFADNSILDISNTTTFSGNTAKQGGAIYAKNSGTSTIPNNIMKTIFNGNKAEGSFSRGGAIYAENSNFTITDSSFGSDVIHEGNTANYGGAISLKDAIAQISGETTFENNSSTSRGGAIYLDNSNLTIDLYKNKKPIFKSNKAELYGGAISLTNNSNLKILAANFTNNEVSDYGGAIDADGGSLSVQDSYFYGNYTTKLPSGVYVGGRGGAISLRNSNNSSNKISNTVFGTTDSGNKSENGGALYLYNSTLDIGDNSQFRFNEATDGGAILVENNSNLTIADSTFENNTATNEGGAIFSNISNVTIKDTSFKGNKAARGAAIYSRGGNVNIIAENEDVVFENNNSTGAQGGTGTGITVVNYGALNLKANADRIIDIRDEVSVYNALNINEGTTGTVSFSKKLSLRDAILNLYGGTLKLSNDTSLSALVSQDIPTFNIKGNSILDLQNSVAGDVLNINTLGGSSKLTFNVDYDGSTGIMDKISVGATTDSPELYLNSINILQDGTATETTYLDGAGKDGVAVRSDALNVATSGKYKYTFTPDSITKGKLSVTRNSSSHELPNYIQDASLGVDKFDITTTGYRVFADSANGYTELGLLNGANRTFTISGGNGDEFDKTINGILADNTKGRGIRLIDNKTLNLQNISDFTNFKGAIETDQATLNVDNVSFSNNATSGQGAVMYLENASGATINNSNFSNNESSSEGGAIYLLDSNVTIKDTNFTGNKATNGSAIYSSKGDVIISAVNKNVLFENNNSTGTQGGTGTGIEVHTANLTLNAGSSKTITINDIISVNGNAAGTTPLGNLYINTNGSGTVYLANTFNSTKTNLCGGTLKLSELAAESTINDLFVNGTTTLDLGNNNVGDVLNINKLSAADGKELDLILDFNANDSSSNNIDKLNINLVDTTSGTPKINLKDINILTDGELATTAKYITGIDTNNLNLRTDALSSVATSGKYVYTFTPQAEDKSVLDITRALSPDMNLPRLIQNKSLGINKFDITTDNFRAFSGNTYTALGELDGYDRSFTISGGNGTDNKTISGILANGNYGDGVSLKHGQTLYIKNISEFKNFNNSITNNNGIVDITNVSFIDNTGYDIKNYNDGILKFYGINSVNKGIIGADGKTTLYDDATLDVNDIAIEQKYVTLKDGAKLNFNAKNNDITIKDISGGIHLNSSDNYNKTANLVLNADEGRTINLENEVTTNKTGSYSWSNKLDNMVDLNGNGEINLKGNLNQVTMNVNGSDIERVSGTDTNVDWRLNNGGYLYYGNDNLLTDQSHLFFNGGSLDLRNNIASTINVGSINLNQNSNLFLDVDLENAQMDRFANNSSSYNGGILKIAGLNLLSDATERLTTINFTTSDSLKNYIEYTGEQKIAYSDLYKYDVKYLKNSGDFQFTRRSSSNPYDTYNPNIFGSSVAMQGAYLTQLANYDVALGNLDQKLLMTQAQRTAIKFGNKYAANDETNPMVYSPLFIPEENAGLWYRPYATFENVRLDNGPKVSNVMYGSLAGGDSDLIELENGWDAQFSGYVGYNGSHQAYDGIGIYQNGGMLGATAAFYKGNFFEAITASIGANLASISTPSLGDNDLAILSTGVASKTGYNFEFADGKFIIQPSFMMSYTYINPMDDYTLGNDVRIVNDSLHAIQLAPSLKFIGNLKYGWQPYANFRMLWNIIDNAKVTAEDVSIPETTVKPYCEYGVGVQKIIGDRLTGFGQAMVRNGGRNGIAFTFGFRWALGDLKDKHQSKK